MEMKYDSLNLMVDWQLTEIDIINRDPCCELEKRVLFVFKQDDNDFNSQYT